MLRELPKHGCNALEIAPTRLFADQPYRQLDNARRLADEWRERWGLPICSMQSIWYRKTESIFGPKCEVDALIAYTKEAILFAQAIHCPNLVFGSPKNRMIPPGRRAEDAVSFFRAIGDFAASHETVIALEGVPASYGTNFLNHTQELYDYVRMVDSDGIRMNLDFGTMLINGEDVTGVAYYYPLTNHVHISEDGLAGIQSRPAHLRFLKTLKHAGYNRYVSIEMRNQNDPVLVLQTVDYVGRAIATAQKNTDFSSETVSRQRYAQPVMQ